MVSAQPRPGQKIMLALVRLSRFTDESTNPETQRRDLQEYCDGHDLWPLWATADMDVSGGTPIRERPGSGEYLTDDQLSRWQLIGGAELDRLFRDARDFFNFAREMRDLGKWIVDVSDGTDTSTSRGMQILEDRAIHAERERLRDGERRRKGQRRIRAALRWGGGTVPYGYEPYQDGAVWYLRPHPEHAKNVRWMAALIVDGWSCDAVTVELNRRGIPPAMGTGRKKRPKAGSTGMWSGKWAPGTVRLLLRDPKLRGYILHYPPWPEGKRPKDERPPGKRQRPKPSIVLGPDGMPLRREPILSDEIWAQLQAALDRNSKPGPATRRNASRLLQVAFCALCQRPQYSDWYRKREKIWKTYRCSGRLEAKTGPGKACPGLSVQADWLETSAQDWFLEHVGHMRMWEKIYALPDDHSGELARTEEAIANLKAEMAAFRVDARAFADMSTILYAKRDELAELIQARESAPKWRETKRTYSEEWASRDEQGQRQLMVAAGFKVYSARLPTGQKIIGFDLDPDLPGRAVRAASGYPALKAAGPGLVSFTTYDAQGNVTADDMSILGRFEAQREDQADD